MQFQNNAYFDIFELKSTQTILLKLFKGLDYFSDIAKGKVKARTLVYGGQDNQDRTNYRVRAWDAVRITS